MQRRDFLATAAVAAAAHAAGERVIEKAGWRLTLDAANHISSLRKGTLELVAPGRKQNRPTVAGQATLNYEVDLVDLGGGAVALKQTVTVNPKPGLRERVAVDVPRAVRLPFDDSSAFLPLFNGVAWRGPAGAVDAAYVVAGKHGLNAPRRLALPMVSESSGKTRLRATYCTDAEFSSTFGESIGWVYAGDVPVPEKDRRLVFTILEEAGEDAAVRRFFEAAVSRVQKGPDWLHRISAVNFDYLSDGGNGWFRDIDTLEKVIARADRNKILLVIHGWYGLIGQYTYNPRTRSLAKNWIAFPNAQTPEVQALAKKFNPKNPYSWKPESIRALRPVEMSIAEMHRRIRYAKDRGFRVALYYGDGLAAGDGLKDIHHPSKVLKWEGWTLPDTSGKSYVQNPLHPEVVSFFQGYMQALLAEYGSELDAFVWDETFYIRSGDLGTPEYPGYASRAMMRLVESLSILTQEHRGELAFLTSDNLGLRNYDVPNAIMAHGNFQDSAMFPGAWDYGLFPNYRNVMWSCNWAPFALLERSRYAAEVFEVPLSLSNGYGEDLGVSEMTRDQLRQVVDVFERRKDRRMEITWLEDKEGKLTYKGRAVTPRPTLPGSL